jgi:ParB family chromosome partitioning protein
MRQLSVPLSRLVMGKKNPRKVKPAREAHQRLVALIRSQGLLQPLVVKPAEDDPKRYRVIAGSRRLAALKEIHGKEDVKVPCVLLEVDPLTADALSLGENFGREAMHPLDEAEAFAKLASDDGKGAEAIAAEFGVTQMYVKQRMKLSTLAPVVKAAYRASEIDTATAEAFAAVPKDRQQKVWKEMNGHPRHAEHVRNVIANEWIDATHALFDVSKLPPSAVTSDLFNDQVLIERQVFMDAQAEALDKERTALLEDGWHEVVVGQRGDVQDRLYAMSEAEPEYDEATTRKLAKIEQRCEDTEAKIGKLAEDDKEALKKHNQKLHALEALGERLMAEAPKTYSEATKAVGTAFLILNADGQAERQYRLPRSKPEHPSRGKQSCTGQGVQAEKPTAPTPEDLSDGQKATTFAHQALAVREALLANPAARKRVLALILHEKVTSEALSVRHDANGTTLHAENTEGFASLALTRLREKRAKADPFLEKHHVDDVEAYEELTKLSNAKLDTLIELLTVEFITAHPLRPTKLVELLAKELKVNIRDEWRPDAKWLASYQKNQLAQLIAELKGPVHAPPPDKKKTDLVDVLAKLFADAADGKLDDKKVAERVNAWMPANLREEGAGG